MRATWLVVDWSNDRHRGAPADGRVWLSGNCDQRVLRGGAWDDEPWDLRATAATASPSLGR